MSESQIDFKKVDILIADDHAFIRNLVKGMLYQAGIESIHVADGGREAVDVLRRRGNGIKCIISDWNMPALGGLELLRLIRTGSFSDVRADLPFIMLTGHASSSVVTAALQLDVSAYVVKPVASAKLLAAIRKALTKSFTAKPAAVYRAVPEIDVPADEEDPAADPAAWAQWVKSGQPTVLATSTEYIDRAPIELTQAPAPDTSQLFNVRFRRADRIKPGWVVAENLTDPEGRPLVSTGTVLDAKLIERLSMMQDEHGEKMRLWVGKREK